MTKQNLQQNAKLKFPEPQIIPVNGIELEVFEAGKTEHSKPLVLCHGWPEHAFSWRHQIPALVEAGYHVIVPNQRGYGASSKPANPESYNIQELCADLLGLLDHFDYQEATFIGHDWGAMVVWWTAQLHPQRVKQIINLAVPYQVRGDKPWIEWMEEVFGPDYYFVHFNRQPGLADAILEENTERFLNNIFRKYSEPQFPEAGMMMINLALAKEAKGEALLSSEELDVFTSAFKLSGFTPSINWYRNLDRNWHFLADIEPIITQPTLMIFGELDLIPKFEGLSAFVPQVQEISLDCGHWIQQELPLETNKLILEWLQEQELSKS